MRPTAPFWLTAAFIVGVFLSGMQYWLLSYRQAELPVAVMGPGLLALPVIAAALVAARVAAPRRALVVMMSCLPCAIILRVVAETWRDPTSHNLWPFEVVMAILVGLVAVLPGVGIGVFLRGR
ncbi:hypothetical protein AAFN86_21490 [Roseomonas sp. CAU 1739]|uniref:hypothetical protein n=1 Tax=Roseomonas sp. CAU 1739 TaxID=3140364 RepID=UPI00325BE0C2